jgi:hypothetical protein
MSSASVYLVDDPANATMFVTIERAVHVLRELENTGTYSSLRLYFLSA